MRNYFSALKRAEMYDGNSDSGSSRSGSASESNGEGEDDAFYPGKIIQLNNRDWDGDGIPDYADAFGDTTMPRPYRGCSA